VWNNRHRTAIASLPCFIFDVTAMYDQASCALQQTPKQRDTRIIRPDLQRARAPAVFERLRPTIVLQFAQIGIPIIAANGSSLAFPSHSIYPATGIPTDDEAARAAEERIRSLRASGELPFPDFRPEDKLALHDRVDYPPEGSVSALPPVIAT